MVSDDVGVASTQLPAALEKEVSSASPPVVESVASRLMMFPPMNPAPAGVEFVSPSGSIVMNVSIAYAQITSAGASKETGDPARSTIAPFASTRNLPTVVALSCRAASTNEIQSS